jgi:hypothetical protein
MPRGSKRAYSIATLRVKKKKEAITYEVICYYQIMVTESMTDITKPANLDVQYALTRVVHNSILLVVVISYVSSFTVVLLI